MFAHATEQTLQTYRTPTHQSTTTESIILMVYLERDAILRCAQFPTHWQSGCRCQAEAHWGICMCESGRAQAVQAVRVPHVQGKVMEWQRSDDPGL
mmetsp:Transcript_46527/g.76270  ORF Transcript_46527/g.76270 Transcript_46527/m.76270 type:complete len:96 (+) Transcript_46527:118-405(+)